MRRREMRYEERIEVVTTPAEHLLKPKGLYGFKNAVHGGTCTFAETSSDRKLPVVNLARHHNDAECLNEHAFRKKSAC
jgi:hypothetical protein